MHVHHEHLDTAFFFVKKKVSAEQQREQDELQAKLDFCSVSLEASFTFIVSKKDFLFLMRLSTEH